MHTVACSLQCGRPTHFDHTRLGRQRLIRPYPDLTRHRGTSLRLQAGLLDRIGQMFQRPLPNQVPSEQQELLGLLASPDASSRRINELIDILADTQQPFVEQSLGGGPWQVVYTRGPLLWQQLTSPGAGGKRVRQGGAQEFRPGSRQLLNFGSLLGGFASVAAEGTYELLDEEESSPNLPKTILAKVAGGSLTVQSLRIPLPIKGNGTVDLLYIDDEIRIFQNSGGSIAVQQKQKE